MLSVGELTVTDICAHCVAQHELFDEKYHAWVCFDGERLLKLASRIDERLEKEGMRRLEGIPVGVKDIMNTQEYPTQMGSPIWSGFTPGNDARVVYYVREAGGLIPGKTVTAEFAVHTLNGTLNPHDTRKTPGTSSSGSAAAVALGMIPLALGTQTAGSIVRPASFCGVYGFKPSFGLIARTGMLKTTDSLDTVGFFSVHAEDLRRLFEVVRVRGPNFPLSHAALSDPLRQGRQKGRPWRIAFVRTHTWEWAYDYAKDAMKEWVRKIGNCRDAEVAEVDLPPGIERAHEVHATIYNKTLSYYFKEEFKKAELVSPIMNELIREGAARTVEEYHSALHEQERLCRLMDTFFDTYDILVSLSTAGEAPNREEAEKPDPALMWTMTHLPVISAPAFLSPSGLPFGAQLAARRFNDYLLLSFCDWLRQEELIPRGPQPELKGVGGR